MAEHGGGKDPISSIGGTLRDGAMGVFGAIFGLGILLGGITGYAPVKASLWDVWAWGQMFGAWIHAGGNSGIQTFGDKSYFENSKKIGDDPAPEQRLQKSQTILPTSTKQISTQELNLAPASYVDTTGKGFISIEDIAAQNKAKR